MNAPDDRGRYTTHMTPRHAWVDSPVGRLLLCAQPGVLTELRFTDGPHAAAAPERSIEDTTDPVIAMALTQLAEYFAGNLRQFHLPLAPKGTPFQQKVWKRLGRIPYGVAVSYADVAYDLGMPTAVRAVGAANGRNPIAIIVPCHRVIGRDGSLTGYAGGLERKRFLLELERRTRAAGP